MIWVLLAELKLNKCLILDTVNRKCYKLTGEIYIDEILQICRIRRMKMEGKNILKLIESKGFNKMKEMQCY